MDHALLDRGAGFWKNRQLTVLKSVIFYSGYLQKHSKAYKHSYKALKTKMKAKHLLSGIAIALCLACSPDYKDSSIEKKPGQEQKIETETAHQYFKSFRTTSENIKPLPEFSKNIDEKFSEEYPYETGNSVLKVRYQKANPNLLFSIQMVQNCTEYEFSHTPDYESLKINSPEEGFTLILLSNEGITEILNIKDEINKVSFWPQKNIYYGAIDGKYYNWETKDAEIQAKFEAMAKKYMGQVFKPAKEKLHVEEIYSIYKTIKE